MEGHRDAAYYVLHMVPAPGKPKLNIGFVLSWGGGVRGWRNSQGNYVNWGLWGGGWGLRFFDIVFEKPQRHFLRLHLLLKYCGFSGA